MKKIIQSFSYALQGCYILFRSERNAMVHLVAAIVVILLGFLCQLSATEWCIITITIVIVLAAEAFNTAIEQLCNHVSPDYHSKIKVIKDLSAAGVLLTAIGAFIISIILFIPKLTTLCSLC